MDFYFDYAATTAVDSRVLEKMQPFFNEIFGNASSTHQWGKMAHEAVEEARAEVGDLLEASPKNIHFTSGATEAINTVLKGFALQYLAEGCHIITAVTEHKAVLDTCAYLEEIGVSITYLAVDSQGQISLEAVVDAIQDDTRLVALMWVNNETGVISPIEEAAYLCKQKSIPLFVDATQAIGKLPINVQSQQIDLLCCSAHKFYGPKGVGALYVREGFSFTPLLHGGGHERGFRSGTLNVAGIVGLGEAARIAKSSIKEESRRITALRELLEAELLKANKGLVIHASKAPRAPHIASIAFTGYDARVLMEQFPEIALSHGSACSSAIIEPSHVLQAMGIPAMQALATLRFSLGRWSNQQAVLQVARRLSLPPNP